MGLQVELIIRRFVYCFLVLIFILGADKIAAQKVELNTVESTIAKITDSLYASIFEVTNIQYRTFLNDLKQQDKIAEYEIAKIDTSKWVTEFRLGYNDPWAEYYHSHPSYNNYPVVNITYEGAMLFCEWLTEKYNSQVKRKYKKVLFRLPTEKEWLMAAKGGLELAKYPWEGLYLKNEKGEQLCNYRKVGDENLYTDTQTGKIMALNNGSTEMPVSVKKYYPNGYGLYNMSGNVAEMLIQKGRTRGGSWNSTGYDVSLYGMDEYEGFEEGSPYIGFRYFMEVVEM